MDAVIPQEPDVPHEHRAQRAGTEDLPRDLKPRRRLLRILDLAPAVLERARERSSMGEFADGVAFEVRGADVVEPLLVSSATTLLLSEKSQMTPSASVVVPRSRS